MIFRELSNAAFRFSLRRPGAEIMGGVQTPPPPPAGGGKSRGPAARRLTHFLAQVVGALTEVVGAQAPTTISKVILAQAHTTEYETAPLAW